jgi:hypothetical protein
MDQRSENDLAFYYNCPARTDDTHGTGSLIEAGIETIRLKSKMQEFRRR